MPKLEASDKTENLRSIKKNFKLYVTSSNKHGGTASLSCLQIPKDTKGMTETD